MLIDMKQFEYSHIPDTGISGQLRYIYKEFYHLACTLYNVYDDKQEDSTTNEECQLGLVKLLEARKHFEKSLSKK